jgi:hypothetical protein
VIYGGKAHPQDWEGKELIRRIFQAGESLKDQIRVVYLEEYDMTLARLFCAGVDLWLNTPQKPQEASGTSGMKAALNGACPASASWTAGGLKDTRKESLVGALARDGRRIATRSGKVRPSMTSWRTRSCPCSMAAPWSMPG